MENNIREFLAGQTAFMLATCRDNIPHCASCFYAYSEKEHELIFKSSPGTRHIEEGKENKQVAGIINPDCLDKINIRGVQFSGIFFEPSGERLLAAKEKYYSRFPFARLIDGDFFIIRLDEVKMTDNSLGIGKKRFWSREKISEA